MSANQGSQPGRTHQETRARKGVLYGLGAYGFWGLVPLFWPLVKRAGALEILASRVVWSLVVSGVLLLILVPKGWWARLRSRKADPARSGLGGHLG